MGHQTATLPPGGSSRRLGEGFGKLASGAKPSGFSVRFYRSPAGLRRSATFKKPLLRLLPTAPSMGFITILISRRFLWNLKACPVPAHLATLGPVRPKQQLYQNQLD